MFRSLSQKSNPKTIFSQLHRSRTDVIYKRLKSYLSEEFQCQQAWGERFKSPIFARLDMSKYFFEIDRKFQQEGRGSSVDVEIFANAALLPNKSASLTDEIIGERLAQLEEILRRFRRTEQSCQMLPSTHHAVVRAFVDANETDSLMRILHNRIEFGIFPDDYTVAFLLNHFLKNENLRDASKVAIEMMLQEEFKILVASQMGLFAAYSYAENLKEQSEVWDPQPPPVVEEPEDDVKIRVPFLESSYRDDHFDLTQREHLLGKTLAKFAVHSSFSDTTESTMTKASVEILGWTLFEKWDKVTDLCKRNKTTLAQGCIQQAQAYAEESSVGDAEARQKATESLSKVSALATDFDVKSHLESEMTASVADFEATLIQTHISNLQSWNEQREEELQKQYDLYLKESKLKELEAVRKELEEKEEELFFFDNYDAMEKKKMEKFVEWRRTWPRRTWAPQIKMSQVENRDPYRKV